LSPTGRETAIPPDGALNRQLCQIGGLNTNYSSSSGTLYHIQIEDRGPVLDRVTEQDVRRLNIIVYANYGESNARIVHGRDHDLPDVRTLAYNRHVQQYVQELASEARQVIEEKEQRQVMRIKCLIRGYYHTKDEHTKQEFEEANALFPFLFSRAWRELKAERARLPEVEAPPIVEVLTPPPPAPLAIPEPEVEAPPEEVLYPLEAELRELVMEIERIIIELGRDLQELRRTRRADDILLQTCRKLVTRAKESITGREPSEFNTRRLEMTRNSLMTTWRQVKSRLRSP
jgi:hypothetical protein